MKVYITSVIMEKDGELKINKLPFKKGEKVEVILKGALSGKRKKKKLRAFELLKSDLVGIWKRRKDVKEAPEYARMLRENAQRRKIK